MSTQQKKNRLLVIVIFAMSIIPFLIAWGLEENFYLLGKRTTNHGQLITPPITTERTDFTAMDNASIPKMTELPGHWLIVNVIPQKICNAICLKALLQTKQLQLMLNKDMLRTRRVAAVFDTLTNEATQQLWLKEAVMWHLLSKGNKTDAEYQADTQLYNELLNPDKTIDDALINRLIGQQNKEAALQSELIKIVPSEQLRKKIATLRKEGLPDGLLLLIDPLGNIMMQYEPGFDPYKVKSDLMHLLRISQIG